MAAAAGCSESTHSLKAERGKHLEHDRPSLDRDSAHLAATATRRGRRHSWSSCLLSQKARSVGSTARHCPHIGSRRDSPDVGRRDPRRNESRAPAEQVIPCASCWIPTWLCPRCHGAAHRIGCSMPCVGSQVRSFSAMPPCLNSTPMCSHVLPPPNAWR